MCVYSYFIICDTNDASCFHIECTIMDYRLRYSAMKSNHIRRFGKYKPIHFHTKFKKYVDELPQYHNVMKSEFHCFYLLEKKEFETLHDALDYKNLLIEQHRVKFQVCSPRVQSNVVTFNTFNV